VSAQNFLDESRARQGNMIDPTVYYHNRGGFATPAQQQSAVRGQRAELRYQLAHQFYGNVIPTEVEESAFSGAIQLRRAQKQISSR